MYWLSKPNGVIGERQDLTQSVKMCFPCVYILTDLHGKHLFSHLMHRPTIAVTFASCLSLRRRYWTEGVFISRVIKSCMSLLLHGLHNIFNVVVESHAYLQKNINGRVRNTYFPAQNPLRLSQDQEGACQ